jgi:hypothetical protein
VSAVSGSQAGMYTAPKPTQHDGQPLSIEARADVSSAEQGVNRTKAEWTYAANNLHRLEPLLS